MSVILLARHGQASFGTEDYDRLSALGVRQSRALGADLAARGVVAERVVTGGMRRQTETADAVVAGAGWAAGPAVDTSWDEFDVLSFLPGGLDGPEKVDSRAFQPILETAMRSWANGDNGRGESFDDFTTRVGAGLGRVVDEAGPGATVVVSTSAGVISWVATSLLGGGIEQWIMLNRVCVNASLTKLVRGRGGVSLISFNEHGHLAGADVTYR